MRKFSLESSPALRIIPLGGLGELGLNCMVVEYGDDLIIIDCGFMFPDENMPGVDLVIPDLNYVRENSERVRGIILTHGHEDHTGALPFLLDYIKAPIYGTPLTLGLLEEKLREFDKLEKVELHPMRPRESVALGALKVEFIRVSHSIVDGVGLAVNTPLGVVIHTGDFKLDQTPVDGEVLDLNRFAEYGERGVLALCSDSTNVESEGYTLSEKEIGAAFDNILRDLPGRLIVAVFSSHIHRIQQIINAAEKYDRYVALVGRNIIANVRIAQTLGYLKVPDNLLIDVKELEHLSPHRVVVITTGSQGEPLSGLTLMAMSNHKYVQIQPGDTVAISAKFIPGNEKTINNLINHLYHLGAEVIYEKTSEIHVSGHASQEELKFMINLTRPRYFIPIHGEYRHLVRHTQLAAQVGIPPESIILTEDGDVVEFTEAGAGIVNRIPTGKVFVDGKGVGDIGPAVLRDRKHLAEDGLVIVVLVINRQTGEIASGPELISRGFVFEEENRELLDEARRLILEAWPELKLEVKQDWMETREEVQKILRRFFNKALKRKPLIFPLIVEM